MNQTPLFLELVRQSLEALPVEQRVNALDKLSAPKPRRTDPVMDECRAMRAEIMALQRNLLELRPAYLSSNRRGALSGVMTDDDRNRVDSETRQILQQRSARLSVLEQHELKHLTSAKPPPGPASFLKELFNESREKKTRQALALHRTEVFKYLKWQLVHTAEIQAEQQQIRLDRQYEKAKSAVHSVPRHSVADSDFSRSTMDISAESDFTVSAELQQQLETENHALLDELNSSLNKARQVEQSMHELSQLQTTLATHLAAQADQVQALMGDALQTSDDVSMANQQLQQAKARNRLASKLVIYISLIMSVLLLFYDAML